MTTRYDIRMEGENGEVILKDLGGYQLEYFKAEKGFKILRRYDVGKRHS